VQPVFLALVLFQVRVHALHVLVLALTQIEHLVPPIHPQ
jgi:hypothetical protein